MQNIWLKDVGVLCMLKDKVELDGLFITKISLESLLGDAHKTLIFPQDKQNVPSATNFLLLLHEKVNEGEVPYNLLPDKKHLYMLSEVFKGILSLYAFVHQSFSEQLSQIGFSAYLLFFLCLTNFTMTYRVPFWTLCIVASKEKNISQTILYILC